ncbi:hypothetical protein SBDP2_540001 [Syntrophobacter sp. SbD2]|nr:hypothetical protein SBDP2_540001 [Syntrophobacter sp. SbD2]
MPAQGLSGPDWLRDWDFVFNPQRVLSFYLS